MIDNQKIVKKNIACKIYERFKKLLYYTSAKFNNTIQGIRGPYTKRNFITALLIKFLFTQSNWLKKSGRYLQTTSKNQLRSIYLYSKFIIFILEEH